MKRIRTGSGWKCPHCNNPLIIRTSATACELMRTYYLQCTEIECSASFKAVMEIAEQLSPSGIPNPIVSGKLNVNARSSAETSTQQ